MKKEVYRKYKKEMEMEMEMKARAINFYNDNFYILLNKKV